MKFYICRMFKNVSRVYWNQHFSKWYCICHMCSDLRSNSQFECINWTIQRFSCLYYHWSNAAKKPAFKWENKAMMIRLRNSSRSISSTELFSNINSGQCQENQVHTLYRVVLSHSRRLSESDVFSLGEKFRLISAIGKGVCPGSDAYSTANICFSDSKLSMRNYSLRSADDCWLSVPVSENLFNSSSDMKGGNTAGPKN